MAVGTLSIATVAPTGQARGEIGKLRTEVRGLGPDAAGANVGLAQLESGIRRAGNTAAEFQAKFGKLKPPSAADPGGHVDLSGDVNRYANALEKSRPFVEQYSRSVKTLTTAFKILGTVGKVGMVVGTFVAIFKGTYEWALKATKSTTDFKDSVAALIGLETEHAKRERTRAAARQQNLERQRKASKAATELQREFNTELASVDRQRRTALFGEEEAAFKDDSQKFGLARANQLRRMRIETANLETRAAEKKRQEEERIEKIKERERKREQAQEKAREQRRKDEQELLKVQRRVSEFGLSQKEKERRNTLRGISDPGLRAQADQSFRQAAQLERMQKTFERRIKDMGEDRKTIAGRSADDTAALDARTVAGFAALRDGERREELKKLDEQIGIQRELLREFQRGGRRDSDVVFELEEV